MNRVRLGLFEYKYFDEVYDRNWTFRKLLEYENNNNNESVYKAACLQVIKSAQ